MMRCLLAIRIKDGLFVGNSVASQDLEFLTMQKVTRVVNCIEHELPNCYESELRYRSFSWSDKPDQQLFSSPGVVRDVVNFIDTSLAEGECVLIHSADGVNRSCAMAAAYLMAKYGWSASSAMEYVGTAHTEMDIRSEFAAQLHTLEPHLKIYGELDILQEGLDPTGFCLNNEQWCLRNTYLNSLTLDHERNFEIRKMLGREKRPKKTVGKEVTFNMTNAHVPHVRYQGGGILTNELIPLEHDLEGEEPCVFGPWRFKTDTNTSSNTAKEVRQLSTSPRVDGGGRGQTHSLMTSPSTNINNVTSINTASPSPARSDARMMFHAKMHELSSPPVVSRSQTFQRPTPSGSGTTNSHHNGNSVPNHSSFSQGYVRPQPPRLSGLRAAVTRKTTPTVRRESPRPKITRRSSPVPSTRKGAERSGSRVDKREGSREVLNGKRGDYDTAPSSLRVQNLRNVKSARDRMFSPRERTSTPKGESKRASSTATKPLIISRKPGGYGSTIEPRRTSLSGGRPLRNFSPSDRVTGKATRKHLS
eukprot:TRINITY_DN8674_c0_g1_i1.p1 TRINITY_DN8674_c0_g1~~TRINITY_DN8674_c0_g1_i1.p1  ORF type:complete len:532 (+),score=76.22 TRINITY_DN8674_c0_g1_i1:1027-2622(+)